MVTDPVEHAALYQELIDVTTEIKSLEPVLLSPDAPVISDNSAAGTIFTKTKSAPTAAATCSRITTPRHRSPPSSPPAGPATSVLDYDTGMTCAPATSTTFYGGFSRTRRMFL